MAWSFNMHHRQGFNMPCDFRAFSRPLRLRTTCHCLSLLVYTFTNNLVSLSSTKGWQKFGVPAWLYADVRKTQLSMHWNGALMFVAESMVCMTLSWKSCTRATSHRKCGDFARPCTWKKQQCLLTFSGMNKFANTTLRWPKRIHFTTTKHCSASPNLNLQSQIINPMLPPS